MASGWIRLQNGYYLPMYSDDREIKFLHNVSTETHSKNRQQETLGSETPLFRSSARKCSKSDLKRALETAVNVSLSSDEAQMFNVRPAIHMDAMAFGMGCCCLQITFQAQDMDESRFIYDQLAVMAPIMMALTASTPVLKGRLADTDCRWGIICESVDDRTPAERGRKGGPDPDPEVAGKGRRRLYKSRYDSISTYIYQGLSLYCVKYFVYTFMYEPIGDRFLRLSANFPPFRVSDSSNACGRRFKK